jgi:hypothetical protein
MRISNYSTVTTLTHAMAMKADLAIACTSNGEGHNRNINNQN